jgi:hypothetical protein
MSGRSKIVMTELPITKCSCGADPVVEKAEVIPGDQLGVIWVECPECGRKGHPNILRKDAIWFWNRMREMDNDK